MANPINAACRCEECNGFTGSALRAYCSLKCRDKAKRKRRKSQDEIAGPAATASQHARRVSGENPRLEYPDSDQTSLDLIAESILSGSPSPVFFPQVEEPCLWQAPEGIEWTVRNGQGQMQRAEGAQDREQ